jgi:hypothetical protein
MNGRIEFIDGKARFLRDESGRLHQGGGPPEYYCCTVPVSGAACQVCSPTNANVLANTCRALTEAQFTAACCYKDALHVQHCAPADWPGEAGVSFLQVDVPIGVFVLPLGGIYGGARNFIVGHKIKNVTHTEDMTVTAVDYDNDTITVTRPSPTAMYSGDQIELQVAADAIAWLDLTLNPRFCWQKFNLASYPLEDYYPPKTMGVCLRLLIWCPATYAGTTYDISAPDFIYSINTPVLGVCDPMNPDAVRPYYWPCCGAPLDLRTLGCLDSVDDMECVPSGDLLYHILIGLGLCADPLPRENEPHMIWAVVSTAHAKICPRPDPEDPDKDMTCTKLDLAYAQVLSAGFVINACNCQDPAMFTCEEPA